MGLFDKVKGFFNVGGAKIEFVRVEDPFPYGDPMHKGFYRVTAEGMDVTINSYYTTFVARWTDEEGREIEELLSEESSAGISHADVSYPLVVKKGTSHDIWFFLTDIALRPTFKEYAINNAAEATARGLKFFLCAEVDIAEAAGLFDPTAEHEVGVIDNVTTDAE